MDSSASSARLTTRRRFRRQARRRRSVLSNTGKELAPAAMSAKDEWTAKVNAKGDEVRKAKAAKADK